MSLSTELQDCIDTVPSCIAAGLVDLESGFMVDIRGRRPITPTEADALAVAAVEMFAAQPVHDIAAASGGATPSALVAGPRELHLFQKLDGEPARALYMAFDASADPAAALRQAAEASSPIAGADLW